MGRAFCEKVPLRFWILPSIGTVPKIDVLAGRPDEPVEGVDGGELGAEFTPTLAHCVALQQARTGRYE
jgi:hypothetical protein